MDQIEKPLSILLIVAAIAYAFMYTDAGDGFTAIENNTASGYTIEAAELSGTGYTIEAAELSTGYNVNGAATCDIKKPEHDDWKEFYDLEGVDQKIIDSLLVLDGMIEVEVDMTSTDEGE